ncbi:MAG: helix-turn-helix transcriptional regulator [Pseudonocardiales bacterium]|nr:helix-turn-helix transcriptional regulator [Pseudonocardiales bacterium]
MYGPDGISQGLLGQWLGLKQPQISRIETGPPILNLDTLRCWARVLRIPPELLWFDLSDQTTGFRHRGEVHEPVGPSSAHRTGQAYTGVGPAASLDCFLGNNLGPLVRLAGEDGEDSMERRAFILRTALLGACGSSTATILEAARREFNRSMADNRPTADADEWQEVAREYGQTYLTTSPLVLLQALIADLGGMRLALRHHSEETVQRQLLQAGALLTAFTAQTAANMGDLIEARRWWRTARQAADRSVDPSTIAWVRGREVVRAGYERRPVPTILQLSSEAESRLAGAPPEVLHELFSGKAQTLALAGRHAEAEQALCQLRDLPISSPHQDSLFDYAEENLRFTESFVYSHVGDFTKAERAQETALTLYRGDNSRGRAQIDMQRALCLVRSGDRTQGTRHALDVITSLPAVHRIRPIADLGQKVFGSIPAHERSQAWAQEYHECLTSSFAGPAEQ